MAQPHLKLLEPKEFQRHLKNLKRQGGEADIVFRQVVGAIEMWTRGIDPQLPLTHKGESRVKHAVKYDLKGYYRLVTYEHAGQRILLMVGNHSDVDKWLDNNKGRDFTFNNETRKIGFSPSSTDSEVTAAITADLEAVPASTGPVLAKIPGGLLHEMKIPELTLNALNRFVTFDQVEGEDIWTLINGLSFPSNEHRDVMIQTIALVARGEADEAKERLHLFLGEARTATQDPGGFSSAVDSGENSDVLHDLSGISSEELQHLLEADGWTDWMLFLHPDQKRLVEAERTGPWRLLGVSGSGKTSVLVHRANYLAKKYPDGKIIILTLNPALVQLLSHLVNLLCVKSTSRRIKVQTVYDYCYSVVKTVAPKRLIERIDPRSGEDLEQCWADFLDKAHALENVQRVIDALESREDAVDGPSYILEELIWIRSGFGKSERRQYLTCDRPGRGVTFPKSIGEPSTGDESMPAEENGVGEEEHIGNSERLTLPLPRDTRHRILRLLLDYEEYMEFGGLLDDDGVSLEAFSLKEKIAEHPELRSRCVLVDEVQDCSSVELAVIAQIPTDPTNGLFLTGDPVQKVFPKQQDLAYAGISLLGRGTVLRKNYRNTKQILDAAFQIILKFKDDSPVPANEILQPEFGFRDGSKPKLYECESRAEQIQLLLGHLKYYRQDELDGICICSPSEESLSQIQEACTKAGYIICRINRRAKQNYAITPGIKFCLLEDIKGYEFKVVFLTDLMDSHLKLKGKPWDERWRVAFQIYVAMTRARDELIMSFIFNMTILLAPFGETVDECSAKIMLC